MKTLNLHVDYIKFKPLKKALRKMEDLIGIDKEEKHIEEALTVMTAVEKHDEGKISQIVEKLVDSIEEIAKQINVKNIVLYPYAHLSKDLSSPETAIQVLIEAEKKLVKNFKVWRAPFGYYKEFEMKVKGHPLSELSREMRVDEEVAEEKIDYKSLLKEISKSNLDRSKLKDNDHRILGQQMDLFSFNEVAPGMVFWHNNGLIIYNELIEYWRDEHKKAGYQEIKTPQIMDSKLWKISGHWDKYKENNFSSEYEKRKFLVKPMNCPGGMLVYKASPKSYKDLPLRVGEIGVVHRVELSGVLSGLFRVIQFTQDDAHIFCTEDQLETEIKKIIDLVNLFFKKFNLAFDHVELSTRPEKRIGDDKMWDSAEKSLEDVLKKLMIKYSVNKGDGAFYGPKIDFHLKDSLDRTWQCATIQLDFSMPERFELEYTDKDNVKKRPVMLHRVIYGSLERFIGVLLEHTNGRLPTWLAPEQVRVLNFTDRNNRYAETVLKKIQNEIPNARVSSDFRSTTVPAKVKDAELMRVPYIIVVGDKEENDCKIALRTRGDKKIVVMDLDEFISELRKDITERR
jgi:threonyl-tRNA synthetase